MTYFLQSTNDILTDALNKITATTPITATSPGSVVRAFTEAISAELGNLYSILDFNLQQFNLSTASGRSLDLIGAMFNINRKTVADLVTIDAALGAFYFYIDTPYSQTITIPQGTQVFTDSTTFIGQQFVYATTEDTTIPIGRTKAYASIVPRFSTSVFTAGIGTLTVMDPNYVQPAGTTVKCNNAKPIQSQVGYETDDSYRFRIQQQVRTAAGGTLDAVRLAGLNVSGVRDITMIDNSYGLGSFTALIVTEDNLINGTTVVNATTAMNAVKPAGVRMYVQQPNLLPVDVSCSIVIAQSANVNQTTITNEVQVAIIRFLNTPLVGTTLVFNELVQAILNADEAIQDVTITNLAVNGTQVLYKNYVPANDEQLIPGAVSVSVAS